MKKKLSCFFIAVFLAITTLMHSQGIGIQVASLIPVGSTAYTLKPGFGGEFNMLSGDIDNRFKFGFTIGYYKFKPTQDTFRTYTIESSYTTQLLPGYESIKKYGMGSAGITCMFKILDKKFSPTVGIDGTAALIVISEDDYAEGAISSSSTNDTYWRFAVCPKAGASYQIKDNWLINAGVGFNVGFGNTGVQAYWKPFLMINYFFD
jgi:outer membrane protein W